MGFSQQEYWSGLPFPPPRIFPTQGLNPHLLCLLHCRQILSYSATGKAPPFSVHFYISVFFCAPQSHSNCMSLTGWLWGALHVFLCNLIFRCHTSSFLLAFVFLWFMAFILCFRRILLLVCCLLHVIRCFSHLSRLLKFCSLFLVL